MMSIENWRPLLPAVRRLLGSHDGVVGVGLGACDEHEHAIAWRVYVEDDADPSSIPREVLGLRTRVLRSVCGRPNADTPPPTYEAGIMVEPTSGEGPGSVGCYALLGGAPVLLTNSHVMFPGFKVVDNLKAYTPKYSSCCKDVIGTPVFTKDANGEYHGGFKIDTLSGKGKVRRPALNEKGYTLSGALLPVSMTDCAIARIEPGITVRNQFPETDLGKLSITGVQTDVLAIPRLTAGQTPEITQYVKMYSPIKKRWLWGTLLWEKTDSHLDSVEISGNPLRMTPLIRDGLSTKDPDRDKKEGGMAMMNQFVILPRPPPVIGPDDQITDYTTHYDPTDPFKILTFSGGESGSVILDFANRVIGQLVAGFPMSWGFVPDEAQDEKFVEFGNVISAGGWLGVASPIRDVITQLGITIPSGSQSSPWSMKAHGTKSRIFVPGMPGDPEFHAQRDGFERLRRGLSQSRRGRLLLRKIDIHRLEVRKLFTNVRELRAAWQALGGPAFFHHFMCGVREKGHSIPRNIDGRDRADVARAILPLLVRHASPALKKDFERYRGWAEATLLHLDSLDEAPAAVAERWRP